jgi:hypothetical protein
MFNGTKSGSVKRDAYTWAVDTYIKGGLVDATALAYYVDYYWTTRPDVPDP